MIALAKSESCLRVWDGDDASRGEVMTMTSMCCLDEALFGVARVGLLCVPLSGL